MLRTFKVDKQRYKCQHSMINISINGYFSLVGNKQPPSILDPAITHKPNAPSTKMGSFIPNPHPINKIFHLHGPSPTLRYKFDPSHIITDNNTITDNKEHTAALARLPVMIMDYIVKEYIKLAMRTTYYYTEINTK